MNKPKPIKPFKTLKEEAAFWDTHDLSVLAKNPHAPLTDLPILEKEKKSMLTVRLQQSMKKKIETIARKKGINPSTLSRMWIIEKVSEFERHQSQSV